MRINGYRIRETIRQHELARDTAAQVFKKSLYVFEGDDREDPQAAMIAFETAENAIVKLQTAQQKYNLNVMVEVQNEKITLCEAVKRLGGAGRKEKMWRDSVVEKERSRYGNDLERQTGTLVAKRAISLEVATKAANKAAGYAGALRAAVALGNAVEMEVDGLDPEVFS
jgi:hypothetical protein